MALIFINRFYWPDEPATGQLLTDLAEALAARGWDVHVIASHSGRDDLPQSETHRGVRITRVRSARSHDVSPARKAFDFGTFFLASLWRLARVVRRGDTIVAMTDPPLLGIGVWLIAKLRGATVVHWIQDIYPELALTLTRHTWLRTLRPLRNASWRSAAACVTLGRDMAAHLTAANVVAPRRHVIPNWPPAGLANPSASDTAALRALWGLHDKFIVAYSGNLGRVHDLEPILTAAALLRYDPQIAFVFIGAGAQRPALEARATRERLPNIAFLPPQPRAALSATLGAADLHLVTLRPGCEALVFPSKLYGAAAVGRPVLFVGPADSEIAQLVRERSLGRAVTRDEPGKLAAAIREFAADSALRARCRDAALRFAAEHAACSAAARWDALLASISERPKLAGPSAVSVS